jgi:hypothetical protein
MLGNSWLAKQLPASQEELSSAELVVTYFIHLGRATAQAVNRWFPTAAGRVRSRVWSSGI